MCWTVSKEDDRLKRSITLLTVIPPSFAVLKTARTALGDKIGDHIHGLFTGKIFLFDIVCYTYFATCTASAIKPKVYFFS